MEVSPRSVNTLTAVLFMSFLAAWLIVVTTVKYGPGLSPDSASYVSAANNVASGKGLIEFDGAHLRGFPPLFPLILSIFSHVGIDPPAGARFFNAVMFGLIVFLSGLMLQRLVHSGGIVLAGSMSVLSAAPLVHVSSWVWTEPFFIVLCILLVFTISAFCREGKRIWLVAACTVGALACLQRYAGVGIVLSGMASIFLISRLGGVASRLFHSCLFGVVAGIPVAAWLAYDCWVTGLMWGEGTQGIPSPRSLVENMRCVFEVCISWFVPGQIPLLLKVTVGLGLVIACAFTIGRRWGRNTSGSSPSSAETLGDCIIIFAVVYTTFIVAAASRVAIAPPGNRYLAPLYPFLIALLFPAADFVRDRLQRRWSRVVVRPLLVVMFFVWLMYPLKELSNSIGAALDHGVGGYSSSAFAESPLIEALKTTPIPGLVYSNAPDGIYLLTELPSKGAPVRTEALVTMRDRRDTKERSYPSMAGFKQSLGSGRRTFLVWFKAMEWRTYILSIDELAREVQLSKTLSTTDGDIYEVHIRP